MKDSFILRSFDHLVNPRRRYRYYDLKLEGYRTIASKEDQRQAGNLIIAAQSGRGQRGFGPNPVKPYRDYYGGFRLQICLLSQEIPVRFAIGYHLPQGITTIDDFSSFSWLRLATGLKDKLYPNLADEKQLLHYLLGCSKYPHCLITRVYYYLQMDLYDALIRLITEVHSGVGLMR